MTRGFVIAGSHSGVGKTTVTAVILAALVRSGLRVQPFKIGPDFIDPGYHRLVTGRTSVNLDPWMMGGGGVRRSYARYSAQAELAIVEGMGTLFDGENGTRARGSAASVAKLLGLGVILVVDVWGMTRSTRALLNGFESFDPALRVEGIVLNRVGGARHFDMVYRGLSPSQRRRCLGYLPASADIAVPERHLGMLTVDEHPDVERFRRAVEAATATLDLSPLLARATRGRQPKERATDARVPPPVRARIGIARDAAFCFYYEENLDLLRKAGAELVPFSPIRDAALPAGIAGLYLGGGYPESFATELGANKRLRAELRAKAASGMPIYAECGGMMYLGRELRTADGVRHPMASVLPARVTMDPRHLAIRYVEVRTRRPTILGPRGTRARGQEFHQSRLTGAPADDLFQVEDSTGAASSAGFATKSTVASYIHLHFSSNPGIARSLVEACAAWVRKKGRVRNAMTTSNTVSGHSPQRA
jgi:cobyrinic acid a,c-diamide synthase